MTKADTRTINQARRGLEGAQMAYAAFQQELLALSPLVAEISAAFHIDFGLNADWSGNHKLGKQRDMSTWLGDLDEVLFEAGEDAAA